MDRIQEIKDEVERLYEVISEKNKKWDYNKPYHEYEKYIAPEHSKIVELDRERRMIMPYKLSELPDYGDVMPLKDFISAVKAGCFIDYDGFGNYVKDNMKTNIRIYPKV